MKTILIGQAPSRTSDPGEPLSGRSGERIAALCGLDLPTFLDTFERYNVLPYWPGKDGKGDRYTAAEIRHRAELIHSFIAGRKVVILGVINARVLSVTWPMFSFRPHCGAQFAWSPHPSGINRWWNDLLNVSLAESFWRQLAQEHHPAPPPRSQPSSEAGRLVLDAPTFARTFR